MQLEDRLDVGGCHGAQDQPRPSRQRRPPRATVVSTHVTERHEAIVGGARPTYQGPWSRRLRAFGRGPGGGLGVTMSS